VKSYHKKFAPYRQVPELFNQASIKQAYAEFKVFNMAHIWHSTGDQDQISKAVNA
jgi:hypothetical protein